MAEEGKKLLIKNGKLINHDLTCESDILIENGKIIKIEPNINDEPAETIDASGFYVLPGGIDSETYLNAERGGVKSAENYFTGTKAALLGGTTTIVNCIEVTKSEDLKTKVESEKSEASKNILCNVAFQAGISDFQTKTRDELSDLITNKTLVPSVRLSCVSKGDHLVGLDDCQLYDIMSWCRDNSVFPCVIAENDRLIQKLEKEMIESGIDGPEGHYYSRNERVEEEAVNRMLTIAGTTHCPLHLSRLYSRNALVKATTTNLSSQIPLVMCGTNLAALTKNVAGILDSDWGKAANHVCVPAVKSEKSAIKPIDIGRLHLVSSGHCVFSTQQKATGKNDFRLILPGSGGIQTRLSVLWEKAVKTGVIEKNRFVELTSTNAAKLHGLYPQKGSLCVGADADIVIWSDRQMTRKCVEACSAEDEENMNCGPAYVVLGGRVIVNPSSGDELINTAQGSGSLVAMHTDSSSSYCMSPVFQQAQLMHSLYYKQCVAIQREPYTGPVATLGGDGSIDKNNGGVMLYSDMVDSAVYQRSSGEERKEALPPGSRVIRTSVKTAQPPGGGSSQGNWWG